MTDAALEILLVEDNPGDVRLTQEALSEARIEYHLSTAGNGADAIDFLLRREPYRQAPRPNLILLDLNLPRKTGREVLAVIRADASLQTIPIAILTSSHQEQDVLDGCNSQRCLYTAKPPTFEAFVEAIRRIHQFWLAVISQDAQP